jgi:multimeric flavodoxin WrbA
MSWQRDYLDREGKHLMTSTSPRYDDLNALFINCTLKPSPELSHTQGLIEVSAGIMRKQGVRTETVRAVDHDIATGVWPDMTEHGAATDAWPQLYPRVLAADILVIAGPIWLGDNSSVTKRVIERLYGNSHLLNEAGQYAYYGRVGGCLITGNEDGVKHRPAAGRRRLDRRGRAGAVLSRSGLGRPGQRFHQPQHHVHDVEPAAPGADAQGRGRHPGPRQPALGMGCRMPLRLPKPRIPLTSRQRLRCGS